MLRFSVSDLESYRYWLNDDAGDLPALLRRFRHEDPPTESMLAGRAFARVMELAKPGDIGQADTADGWRFNFRRLDAEICLPPYREIKAEKVFQTPSGPVTLVGKVDALDGLIVRDQKLTERWDAERYADSLQWRCYLDMFGAKRFIYDVFVGRYRGRTVEVVDYHPMTFTSYPEIGRDVEIAVHELAAVWAKYIGPEPAQPRKT
jgi:hypothetical protein